MKQAQVIVPLWKTGIRGGFPLHKKLSELRHHFFPQAVVPLWKRACPDKSGGIRGGFSFGFSLRIAGEIPRPSATPF
jgi:hypothetical protein